MLKMRASKRQTHCVLTNVIKHLASLRVRIVFLRIWWRPKLWVLDLKSTPTES